MSATTEKSAPKFTLMMMIAMVVGSMVGAGVFSLPHRFAGATGVAGTLIAWVLAGVGMLMLAFVFQNLAKRKPEIDAGVFAYAKAGFGDYLGFVSAFGYWTSACVGNVFYWVLIMATLSAFFPALGDGNTVIAVGLSSIFIWTFYFMVLRGVKEAAAINKIVTIAKILPLILFLIIALWGFDFKVFSDNFWGMPYGEVITAGKLYEQVKATMMVTVFVFIGIEGASIYSRYAKNREDVGRATVIGFLSVLCLFVLVTVLSFGILPREDLANLADPSVGGVLAAIVGEWGAVFIGIGLIVSVLGAYLAWSLMCAEVLFLSAKNKDMPQFLVKENDKKVPANALLMSFLTTQTILLLTILSDDALTLALTLAAALSLIPYFFSAAYALKLTITKETYETDQSELKVDYIVALIATIYGAFLIYAAGGKLLLLSCVIYAPGTVLYIMARREQKLTLFKPWEKILCIAMIVAAVVGIFELVSGNVDYKGEKEEILEKYTPIDYLNHISDDNYIRIDGKTDNSQ